MSRVLVLGAGAIGGLLAALLREANHDVAVVARPAQVDVIVREGLLLSGGAYGPPRRVPLRAAPEPPRDFRPDLVVAAVKTQDLRGALAWAARASSTAPVVAIQNGLAQDEINVEVNGAERAVAAVVALDAQHVEPGHVECARTGTLIVGAPRREGERAAETAARLLAQAVRMKRSFDVRAQRWTKLLVNLGNVVPAITGLPFQETSRDPALGLAHVRMIREGLAVARAEGARLGTIPWASPILLRALGALPEQAARRAYALRVRAVLGRAPAYGSTWQSLRRGRSVETPWLNGEVVRRGERLGVPTPVNAAACALAESGKTLEADEAGRMLLA